MEIIPSMKAMLSHMQVTGTFTPKEIKNLESKMSNVEEKTDFKKSTPVLGIDSKTKEIEKFSDPLPDCKGNSVEERLLIPGPPLFPLFRRFWLQSIRSRVVIIIYILGTE